MEKILIIDDEPQLRSLLARIISLEGYEVIEADSIASGRRQIAQQTPGVVLCDVFLPDGNGVEAIGELKRAMPDGEIIMLTAHGNIADGVRAIKNGAYDYLTKGDDNNRIIPMLAAAAEQVATHRRLQQLESLVNREYTLSTIIGTSRPLLSAVELARKVAATDTAVLLTGETGTGKEVFANAIHAASTRRDREFVAINCSALSSELLESELFGYRAGAFTGATRDKKGLFEQADRGTIFLDEIGEMPTALQSKLLRTLESGEFIAVGDTRARRVDVRIIAATHRNLREAIADGSFREDLFYRLSVFSIELPPLRERGDDVLLLADSFRAAFAAKMHRNISGMSARFAAALRRYEWRGNIRELRNTVERSVILASGAELTEEDLPTEILAAQSDPMSALELTAVERTHIAKILKYTDGNKSEAARLMKIGLTTLYRKIDEYGIKA